MSRCWIISDVPVVPSSYAKTPLFVKRKLKGLRFQMIYDLRLQIQITLMCIGTSREKLICFLNIAIVVSRTVLRWENTMYSAGYFSPLDFNEPDKFDLSTSNSFSSVAIANKMLHSYDKYIFALMSPLKFSEPLL